MKKFFKFFAVALVAGAMFTACGEDPVNPEGPDTPDTPDTPTIADGIHVTFGEESWDAATDFEAEYLTLQDGSTVSFIFAGKEAGLQTFPMINIAIDPNASGEQTTNIGIDGQYLVYDNDAMYFLDYYKSSFIPNGQTTSGDWWCKSATWKVSEWDATQMNLNMDINAVMYDAVTSKGNPEGAPTENMQVVLKNVQLVVPQQ